MRKICKSACISLNVGVAYIDRLRFCTIAQTVKNVQNNKGPEL